MDRGFRTSAQLEATLQVPCLSLVPLLKKFPENYTARSRSGQTRIRSNAFPGSENVLGRHGDAVVSVC